MLSAHQASNRARQHEMMALAWYVNALERTKRLPTLKKLLGVKPKKLTPEQIEQAKADHEEALRLTGGG